MNSKREERRRAAIEQQIDENLKRVYEQDATQQIPDKFLELLEKLRDNGFDQGNPA
ncbi:MULTISPECIES: NepR family anti-sigma factor [Paracoccus]|jgi:hypothetical protein|uniref:Transcriptional regulator n=2 Tax=Paracoccus TaxID=265 RepID=A0A2D2BYM8_9RHOB|nr:MULTISPECIES: NepR family anti-sigma factor [Paracoccus]ATQ55344.1 transcriptional regulator [Paracoccus yeei]AWX93083.1 transcriptional regulator [Paracoccus mutanolyticus]AYF02651.1 hypothetical protein PY32053_03067 [Paracoccus yeei]MBY0138249.1 transcriptional regulator [Paracoccus yeei]OWJ93312.1 transcriptional regulator [Paracoccus yeei]